MINFVAATAGAIIVCFTDISDQKVGRACQEAIAHAAHDHGLGWAKASEEQRAKAAQQITAQLDVAITARCEKNAECQQGHRQLAQFLFSQITAYAADLLKKI